MPDRITVLQSLRDVTPMTNPYLVMLGEGLRTRPGLDLIDFSYRTALFGRYDVFHVHWPEIFTEGRTPARKLVRQVLWVLILARMSLQRIPIVRTVHNLQRPEGLRRHEYAILSWVDRLSAVRIRLNSFTPTRNDQEWVLIPHGHYRDWFAAHPHSTAVPGRFGFVGQVRRYKGVEDLITAFRATAGWEENAEVSLRISGRPTTERLGREVSQLADSDPRVQLDLRFITDPEWVRAVTSAELVVLPYRFMHNSGGTLACLSLARPVLIPDNPFNAELSAEVGPGWIQMFSGALDADDLRRALAGARTPRSPEPDLSARSWADTAAAHEQAYRRAIDVRRRTRAGSSGRT